MVAQSRLLSRPSITYAWINEEEEAACMSSSNSNNNSNNSDSSNRSDGSDSQVITKATKQRLIKTIIRAPFYPKNSFSNILIETLDQPLTPPPPPQSQFA